MKTDWTLYTNEELEQMFDNLDKAWDQEVKDLMDSTSTTQEYMDAIHNSETRAKLRYCNAEINRRAIKDESLIVSKVSEDFGDLMTLEEFKWGCKNGPCFTSDDGFGYYSDGEFVYRINASTFAFYHDMENKNFSHVMWYNK